MCTCETADVMPWAARAATRRFDFADIVNGASDAMGRTRCAIPRRELDHAPAELLRCLLDVLDDRVVLAGIDQRASFAL